MGLSRLHRAMQRQDRLCVGLLSGTSIDAAEAVVCRIQGTGAGLLLEFLTHHSSPFPPDLKRRVLQAASAAELSDLNFELGERFAEAALVVISKAGLSPQDIDLVGSHGQTVAHLPPRPGARASTLQLGEASVIAERTGIPVVCDFRTRDVAAGGHGAPLVPYADWVLFRKPGVQRALLNIGGIANVSAVSERIEDTVAFDTGPGNMVLDALAERVTQGALGFDLDGTLSAKGQVNAALLRELLQHPFLQAGPPKSSGREAFGHAYADALWKRFSDKPYDLLATAAALTVESTVLAMERWVLGKHPMEAMYVSGGGSRNPTLMTGLAARLSPLPVRPLGALGFPEEAKEAVCFALLASECLSGVAQNIPTVTGAGHPVILGKILP
jgi:anhydro-N-acetylmuramic acid kinase